MNGGDVVGRAEDDEAKRRVSGRIRCVVSCAVVARRMRGMVG